MSFYTSALVSVCVVPLWRCSVVDVVGSAVVVGLVDHGIPCVVFVGW